MIDVDALLAEVDAWEISGADYAVQLVGRLAAALRQERERADEEACISRDYERAHELHAKSNTAAVLAFLAREDVRQVLVYTYATEGSVDILATLRALAEKP